MAASYTLVFNCRNCGRGTITITNTLEGAGAAADVLQPHRVARCTICGQPAMGEVASIVIAHSGNVGAHTGIVHTVTNGTISSATN